MRVSEAKRLSEDALFWVRRLCIRLSVFIALVLCVCYYIRDECYTCEFLLFCPVELESVRLEFYANFN